MSLRAYLPSTQFGSMAFSVVAAGGLVLGAWALTRPIVPGSLASTDTPGAAASSDWQNSLEDVQAQAPNLPQAPDQSTTDALLTAAQSHNLTSSVSRSLLVNLSAASAQGLGQDLPTQDKLISSALSQIDSTAPAPPYTQADITAAAASKDTMRAWGNGVMRIIAAHPQASAQDTYLSVGYAVDYQDTGKLDPLKPMAAAYKDIAAQVIALPVPTTLAPLALSIANNFAAMSATYADMLAVTSDPLRGLAGLQHYEQLQTQTQSEFTTVAQQFNKDGILFSKDEPGASWALFLSQ
ncbi:MAG: hypothetical protein KGI70_01310 [Patescibacteria group bacterium]|nr:hypothetical protein [Patescibacteria group bacterium]